MSEQRPPYDGQEVDKPKAVGIGASLYPADVAKIERVKDHFGLTSTAAALRLALTVVVRQIDNAEKSQAAA